jgi:16S rRNA (cytidine1402-2'-O)-methyltransferase
MTKGCLYLLPSFLGDDDDAGQLSSFEIRLLHDLKLFFCENEKSCRRFMRKAGFTGNFDEISLHRLDKDSSVQELLQLIQLLESGQDAGLISEAGAPALADPGTIIIREAHQRNIEVIPVPGPSAIMLAIIASGLNGQAFSFKGYLPVERNERKNRIKELEKNSALNQEAQFFIETPYRNDALFEDMLSVLKSDTWIHLSANIGQNDALIKTRTAANWKNSIPALHKKPCVFGILSN